MADRSARQAGTETILSVRSLAAGIGGRRLLEGLDLDLRAEEVVALRGPSGCGRSTLLRSLAGLVDPLDGTVELRGKSAGDHGWPRYRRQVCYVAQRPVVLDRSVRGNLSLPFDFSVSRAHRFDRSAAARLLADLGLPDGTLEVNARTLSEGQLQRVCFARALLIQPRVLLLDEPTSALDGAASRRAEGALSAALRATSAAALIVTHQDSQVDRLAARVVDLEPFLLAGGGHG